MNRNTAEQGDILKIALNPTLGHEQAGHRPVLAINNDHHARASNMTLVCPITNTDRHSPLHDRLDGQITTGFVMCDQIRAVDLRARQHTIIESIDEETLLEVCDIVQGMVDAET